MSTNNQEILNQLQKARIPKDKKPKEAIAKRGEKMKDEMKEYKKEVKEYLAKEENEICLIQSPVCTKKAVCVNHKRRRGKNLRNQKDWEPSCAPCNNWIESHTAWAVENGHLISPHIHQKDQPEN